MIAKWQSYWFYRNSPCQCNWNCMKNSMENIDNDDRVWRLNNNHCFFVYCAIWMDYSNRNNYKVCAAKPQSLIKKKDRGERWVFVLSRARDKEKILSPHEESNLSRSDLPFIRLIFLPILYTKHDAIDILAVCRTRVIYELLNGPCSPSSLCSSVVEHRSAVSDSLCYVFFKNFVEA